MKGADKVFVDLMNRQTMKVCTEGQENSDIYGDLRIRDGKVVSVTKKGGTFWLGMLLDR